MPQSFLSDSHRRTKRAAFDLGGLHQMLGHPAVMGSLLGSQPQLLHGLTGMTGGLGLFGLVDYLHRGGSNFGSFLKGPISGRSAPGVPAPAAPAAMPSA